MLSFDCTTMKWLAANPARLRPLSLAFILLPLAVGMPAPPAAAQYSYTTISKVSGTYFAQVTGVNDAGTVVGYYQDSSGIHGFIWTGGNNFTTFDFPGAVNGTYPAGINNSGVIAGTWYGADFYFGHGFVGVPGNFASFDPPGAGHDCAATWTTGINNLGVIVGNVWDANCVGHGFIDNQGAFTSFDVPGSVGTYPSGINDSGQIVGLDWNSGWISFLYSGGQFSVPTLPDGSNFKVYGIDNSGGLLGVRIIYDSSGVALYDQALLLANGKVTPIYPPGSPYSVAYGISSSGNQIVGYGSQGPFLASAISLLDPVPDLMVGPAVADDAGLASSGLGGRPIQAVAADGVTEAVIRIPATNVGDQFTITLLNDQQAQSSSPFQDGVLGTPGGSTFTQSQITVSAIAVSGSQQPFAFAIYVAPVDFARQNSDSSYMSGSCNGGPLKPDDQLACRTVYLQIQGAGSGTLPITILRPPVLLIHGLWSNPGTWDNFTPLIGSGLFYIERARYDWNLQGQISQTTPTYPPWITSLQPVHANSLGFEFNAQSSALPQTLALLIDFKQGSNRLRMPAAAAQADIVAHSMGGDVARAMALEPDFLADRNFAQGYIHKMITIGTPHLGSPLANQLLSSDEVCSEQACPCVEGILALVGMYVFDRVSSDLWNPTDGAILDLEEGSLELSALAGPGPHQIPTALIAGINPNFGPYYLGSASALYTVCAQQPVLQGKPPDPIGTYLDSAQHWSALFNNGEFNDGIVSGNSALAGMSPPAGTVFTGFVHSTSMEGYAGMGFAGPSLLDPESQQDNIPNWVIHLLNTPVTNNAVFTPLNP